MAGKKALIDSVIQLAEVTTLTSSSSNPTDYANPTGTTTNNPLNNPWRTPTSAPLAPTGGTGLEPPPEPPSFDPNNVPGEIIAALTTFMNTVITRLIEYLSKNDLAPNGVESINKREWTDAEFQQWLENLPTKNTPQNTPADLYEIFYAGSINYTTSGNGKAFNADGIYGKNIVLETKYVENTSSSPYIPVVWTRLFGQTSLILKLEVSLKD